MAENNVNDPGDLIFTRLNEGRAESNFDEITPRYFLTDPDAVTAESVCGIDNRVKVTATTILPYKAICKLYMGSPTGKSYIGSGWLTDKKKLYTAAHCVFDLDAGDWMESIIVVPGKSGLAEPYGQYHASELAATRGWIEQGSARYDMGAIKFSGDVNHSDFLTPELADPNFGEVCGYPADRDTGVFQYKMSDTLTKNGGQFQYLVDTFGGQSGCPLLRDRTRAVGIHNYGGCPNSSSDLYQEFIDSINNW